MPGQHLPPNRFILDSLPPNDREHLLNQCMRIDLEFGQVLYSPPEQVKYVYFPISGFVSLLRAADDTSSVEIGMIGREGMLGNHLNTLEDFATVTALVQGAGEAWRMGLAQFRLASEEVPSFKELVQRHSSYHLRQMAQTVACTAFHKVEQRLARWLLMTSDRAESTVFPITHEFLAYMLGVRRPGVTVALGALQKKALIAFRRGEITINDHHALAKLACPCYAIDRDAYRNELQSRLP